MRRVLSRIYKILPHLLFAVLLIGTILLEYPLKEPYAAGSLFALLAALEIFALLKRKRRATSGIVSILFAVLLIWTLYPILFPSKKSFLFPPPQRVTAVLAEDILVILKSIFSSLWLLLFSFLIALVLGVALGLVCGRYKRLQNIMLPVAQVLSPIPALIYAPYAVAVLPNFTTAAIFIISSGLFWPIMLNVIITIQRFDQDLLNSAKVLNLNSFRMIAHVYLPYCLPSLFNTLSMQISNAFLLLVGAEMMGMTSGVGWYVKYFSDFSDYVRVIAGFIVIGVLVSVVNAGLAKVQKAVLLWKQ